MTSLIWQDFLMYKTKDVLVLWQLVFNCMFSFSLFMANQEFKQVVKWVSSIL